MEKKSAEQLLFASPLVQLYKVLAFILHPLYMCCSCCTSLCHAPGGFMASRHLHTTSLAHGHPKHVTILFPSVLMNFS